MSKIEGYAFLLNNLSLFGFMRNISPAYPPSIRLLVLRSDAFPGTSEAPMIAMD